MRESERKQKRERERQTDRQTDRQAKTEKEREREREWRREYTNELIPGKTDMSISYGPREIQTDMNIDRKYRYMCVCVCVCDIKSTVNYFFDEWDPSSATLMEEMCTPVRL